MTLTTILPYIPPHKPKRRPPIAAFHTRICFGTLDGLSPSKEVHECPWCCKRLRNSQWPSGAEWVAFPSPVKGKIVVLGPRPLQGTWDEPEARVMGVWV